MGDHRPTLVHITAEAQGLHLYIDGSGVCNPERSDFCPAFLAPTHDPKILDGGKGKKKANVDDQAGADELGFLAEPNCVTHELQHTTTTVAIIACVFLRVKNQVGV